MQAETIVFDLFPKGFYGEDSVFRSITPLHIVEIAGIAKVLISAGADVNAKDSFNRTPLHYARTAGIAKNIIAAGADVNAKDNFDRTPLHLVKTTSVAKVLIDAGADVNAKSMTGATALYHNYKTAGIAKLLINAGANVTIVRKRGFSSSPLYTCIDVLKVLIESGADIHTDFLAEYSEWKKHRYAKYLLLVLRCAYIASFKPLAFYKFLNFDL